jgi:hypothetical protein
LPPGIDALALFVHFPVEMADIRQTNIQCERCTRHPIDWRNRSRVCWLER